MMRPRLSAIRSWRSFPSRIASFSATATTTSRAKFSSSRSWRRTLERIADNPDDFYHGAMARELAAAIQKGGGLITADDLAQYEVKERQPIRGTYRGYEIISAPPPSSGGIALVESLNILEGYDLAKQGDRSAQSIHLTAEAFQRAFFDRAEFLGDPDFSKIPVAQLIDKRYGNAWRETIPLRRATPSADLRRPSVFSQLDSYASSHPQPKSVHEPESHHALLGGRSRRQCGFGDDHAERRLRLVASPPKVWASC